MAHSKRNTSRSVFTSYEREMARAAWSSTSACLTRDSFLPFGSCCLCLEMARDPVSCSQGDIFCRECAVANLFSQKKEINRMERLREMAEREFLEAQARHDADAQECAVKEFEKIQAGLNPSSSAPPPSSFFPALKDIPTRTDAPAVTRQGSKRKFILDQDKLDRIAKEDCAKAQKYVDEDKTSKDKMPFFWTPSQTPDAAAARKAARFAVVPKKMKLTPICPASADASQHPYSLKCLIPLKFKEEVDPKKSGKRRICPSCVKTLGNASRPLLATKCGHIICRSCAVKLMKPIQGSDSRSQENVCYVCDARLEADRLDGKQKQRRQEFFGLIELKSEGTGFSARGANKVEKRGVAFQC